MCRDVCNRFFFNNVIIKSVINVQFMKSLLKKKYPDPILTSYLLYIGLLILVSNLYDLYVIPSLHLVKGWRMH